MRARSCRGVGSARRGAMRHRRARRASARAAFARRFARATGARARACVCVLVACASVAARGARAQTPTPTPAPPPPAPGGLAASPFGRANDYEYKVCADQPGSYTVTDADGVAAQRAQCVSLDAGELGFCSGVAWDACVHTDPPLTLDKRVLNMFDTLTLAQTAMYPELAGDPDCLLIMSEYMCALTFPRCDPDPIDPLIYYELPACWDYCLNSVFACTGDYDVAKVSCNASLASGVVAPEGRPDIRCTSAAEGVGTAGRLALGVVLAFTLALA